MNRVGPLAGIVASSVLALAACGSDETPGGDSAQTASPSPSAEPGGAPTASPTAAPTESASDSPSPAPTPEVRAFTLAATGDVLLHEPLWTQARLDADPDGTWNFSPQLRHVRPVIEAADLAVCHLEVPIAPVDGPFEAYPTFSGPPQIVPALAETGYDACTTASNHTFDQGAAGVDRTLDALDDAGLSHAGSARTPEEADEVTIVDVDTPGGPVAVALISYTFGFNGIPYPDGETWRSNLIERDAILDDAAAARESGAEVVVVSMHWGDEYVHEPNAQQSELAPTLIASPDIDLLLGHHAHVVQPVEEFDGQWVVYGMGNMMANHAEPKGPRSEGLLVRFTFSEEPDDGSFTVTAAEYLPLYQTYEPPVEVLDVPGALAAGEVGSAGQDRLEQALDRTVEIVESRKAADAGLSMIDAG
ncbi:CapA family protein [Phytoactinopolyspora alkaliphila]|uniref:CapA family protein n=1 Tax=Phytoactinopolyspora alkaliphila TaxID=1783498 RepID=A0A6N9YUL2_9ACTN|nr:CapA family protein [Phytoactinopolyspora alkaliphila]NED98498.1 CapA family protein [Phytoactinopolyspora alkaliphila]